MSSSDQQYPYGQSPYRPPHEDPYGQQPLRDADETQTWQGETWDTQYQPVVPPAAQSAPGAPAAAYGQPAPSTGGYGQPVSPAGQAYGHDAPHSGRSYGQDASSAPGMTHCAASHESSGHGVDETAYLAPVAPAPPTPSLSQPLPPEAPFRGPATGHGTAVTAGGGPAAGQSYPPQNTAGAGAAPAYGTGASAVGAPTGAPAHAAPADVSAPSLSTTGYSPPTVGGNTRITDAQRARAEGRSPIIAPGMQPAGLTAVLALLLAGGAAVGPYALLVPLVLLQAVTAAGWFRLNGMWPARQGIALAFLGGLAADAALLASGDGNGPAAIIGTLGVWVLLTVVLQLRSHAGADERMYGLMATVVSAALAILATGHLVAAGDAVVVGAAAVAVAVLARALPLGGAVSVVLSLAAAAGAGVAAGGLTGIGSDGALLGLAAGGCALIGLRVASYDYPSRFVHMTAGVALPLTAAAPVVHLLGRALS
ncbi:hypothetical protein [Streptomyces sp. NPDC003023]|uniref:hypothetical protein n=1 Tax=Streptomyces sp. NPDC003023 TaxID=3364675 RepID=UPI0036941322